MPCLKCKLLVKSRQRIVKGYGSGKSGIMFIGIAPGCHLLRGVADSTGIPFKGDASGRLFERLLADLGLTREDVYTTNLVKCRPASSDKLYNRLPSQDEIANCFPSLLREIQSVGPFVIVCFGHIVYETLIKEKAIHKFILDGYSIFYTWHPAYIARDSMRYNEWLADIKMKIGKRRKS